MSGTIGERLGQRDSRLFVGRERELRMLEGLFVEDPSASVVHIHGPGGIGKSALAREAGRRAAARGWSVHWVNGRDLPPLAGAVEEAVALSHGDSHALIVFDTYERMLGLDGYLRRELVPSLAERTVVLTAGRSAPQAGWFEQGWESVSLELALEPLTPAESRELLARHGVEDPPGARAISSWAAGSPLALSMLADALAVDAGWRPGGGTEPPELVRALVRRLLDPEVDHEHQDVLAIAAIARVVTPALLRVVLPNADAEAGYRWLRSRTFSEAASGGTTLHTLVRRVLRTELRAVDPMRERELRRRIVDYLHTVAVAGDLLFTIDMAALAEDPVIRSGYSWDGGTRYRIDPVRSGDADEVARALVARGHAAWWESASPYFELASETIGIARSGDDRLCGYSIAVTPATAPSVADPVLGRWLEHARALDSDGNAVLAREVWDFTGDPASGVLAMVAMSCMLRSGLSNPRYVYLPIESANRAHRAFSAALGGRHLAELDVGIGDLRFECHLVDYGPGGLLGAQRDLVYREIGLTPPRPAPEAVPTIGREAVREALRAFHQPGLLAESPLAVGATPAIRARSVRDKLEEALEECFGDTAEEHQLRQALKRAYIDPAPNLDLAADELHLSRATYFRRLRRASERVAGYVLANGDRPRAASPAHTNVVSLNAPRPRSRAHR